MNQATNQPIGRALRSHSFPLNGHRGPQRGPKLVLALQSKLLFPNPVPESWVSNLVVAVRGLRAKDASVSESLDVAVVITGLSPGPLFLRPTIYLTKAAAVFERLLRQDPSRPGRLDDRQKLRCPGDPTDPPPMP